MCGDCGGRGNGPGCAKRPFWHVYELKRRIRAAQPKTNIMTESIRLFLSKWTVVGAQRNILRINEAKKDGSALSNQNILINIRFAHWHKGTRKTSLYVVGER
jgi:hypothetical protein